MASALEGLVGALDREQQPRLIERVHSVPGPVPDSTKPHLS